MSISFNGLASGLDTSSWITSLTALKQAKVTTLQQQREELVVSKNTLSSIRSFFTSFRSTLEKITDSRFNIVSMNLFAQNLATSANLNVLSATATSEAEEGKYEVKVDKVATNTQAVSKHKYTALVEKTRLAGKSSTLVSIGANEGSFTINLDGDIKTVNITSDTTIGSLINTLKGYGIDAEFNEKTGIFSADIDADDITENGTNIKNALHLVSENKGYFSTDLTYDKVDENAFTVANENTLIWDIQGMNSAAKEMVDDRDDKYDENNRTLTLTAGGESFYVYLDDDETIGSLVNDINNDADLQAKGVVASFENGVFKLVNAVVSGAGQTGFDEAFGMGENISTNIVQKSENLSYEAPVQIYKSVSLDSKLANLNTGIRLYDGDTVEVTDSNGVATTITMSDDMTIGDLFAEMEAAGLEITLNDNDTVDLTSGVVTGGTYDVLNALGLRDGGVLREKTVQVVNSTITEDTTLGEMGISGTLTIYNEDDSVHETITIDANSEMTMGEFLDELESKGITSATLTDGVITLNSDENRYVAGDLATAFGIDVIGTTNESSTLAVTYTQKLTATGETKLVDVDALESIFNGNPATTANIFVYDSNGTQVNTITIAGSESLDDLVEKLNTAGFEAELESGRISLSSTNGDYLGGAVASALGLNAVRTTVANTITSDTPVIYEKTQNVTSTIGITQSSTDYMVKHINTTGLTALSSVTAASMVSGRTYKISTTEELDQLASIVDSGTNCQGVTFVLANDISYGVFTYLSPIGNDSNAFSGVFDGNGYKISGIKTITNLEGNSYSDYGLFARLDGATVKNLSLLDVRIQAGDGSRVGALAASAVNSTIQNVYTEGSISGTAGIGGLVGYCFSGVVISDCVSSANVTATSSIAGGLVGTIEGGTIICSASEGTVSGTMEVGGIAGRVQGDGTTLTSVYATGTIINTGLSTEKSFGALVGNSLSALTINTSYSTAKYNKSSDMENSASVQFASLVGTSSAVLTFNTCRIPDNGFLNGAYYNVASVSPTISNCATFSPTETPFTIIAQNVAKGSSNIFQSPYIYNTKLSEYGLGLNYITVSNQGTLVTLTISATDTLSSFSTKLEKAGLTVEFSLANIKYLTSGMGVTSTEFYLTGITISGNEDAYIVGDLNSSLEKALCLEDKGTAMTTTKASTTTINATLTEDTTFAELGFDSDGNKISYTLYSANGNEIATYSHNSHLKMEDFLSVLNNNGFTAEIVDGRLSIESNNGNYIVSEHLDEFNITDPTYTVYSANAGYDYKTYGTTATSTVAIVASAMTTVGITQTSTSKIKLYTDTTGLTALSAVTSSDMVSGRTYKISTTADLEALATIVNSGTTCEGVTFVMSNDISLSDAYSWTAIGGVDGTTTCAFSGTFDGNGYEISGLTVAVSKDYAGLFGYIDGATIKNLDITGYSITNGSKFNGALAGRAENSTIQNVNTSGSMTGGMYSGGLVGYALNSSINNVKASGNVGGSSYVGGVVGQANYSNITTCQSSGTILALSDWAGGIVGVIYGATITSSSSSASVNAKSQVGGIAGYTSSVKLISVYATGTIDDTDNTNVYYSGGLVGRAESGLTIQNSYTKASVTDQSGGGSVVGYVASGTALISNTTALGTNYYASIATGATATSSNCTASTSFTSPFTITINTYATSTTKMSEIGLNETKYITVMQNGTEAVITVDSGRTLGGLVNVFEGYGFTASFTDGKITIAGAENVYIKGELDDKLDNILNLSDVARTYTVIPNTTSTKGVTFTSTAELEKTSSTYGLTALSAVTEGEVVSGKTFKISSTEDLQALATLVNNGNNCAGVTFVVSNDIDLSNAGNWIAIGGVNGTTTCVFSGTLDGNGYEISGLSINASTTYQGLFGYLDGATIKNLSIKDYNITSTANYAGALAGYANNTTINNVYTEGTIQGRAYVGGLFGYALNTTATRIETAGSISGTQNVGGLVGCLCGSEINSSASSADVTGSSIVGGVVGCSIRSDRLTSVYATGTITGNGSVGGLVGKSTSSGSLGTFIENSYFIGNVSDGGYEIVGTAGARLVSVASLSTNISGGTATTTNCSIITADTTPFTIEANADYLATVHTKLGQLGLKSTRYVTINNNGTTYTCTATSETTLGDFINDLKSKGLDVEYEDYKLTINQTNNVYIVGELDDALDDIFNFSNVYTSNAIENVTEANATLDEIIQAKYGLDWASWTGNSEIEIYNNGTTTTIDLSTIKGSTTTGEFFDILESAGLTCSISNGIVSISGGEDVFISSDRDNKLADLFGFSGNYTSVQVSASYLGNSNSVDVTKTMTEATTLGELADRVITVNVAQEMTNLAKNVSSLTALSAVTASDMVAGRTFKISTTADLEKLATIVNGGTSCSGVTFVMSNDIDLSSIDNWTAIGGVNGTTTCAFSGTFDGNGYEISGMTIDHLPVAGQPLNSSAKGLFGVIDNATIKNLGIVDYSIVYSRGQVGALAASATNSTIQYVYTEGSIAGTYEGTDSTVGGLIGSANYVTVSNVEARGEISQDYYNGVGGLFGHLLNSTVLNSSTDVDIQGNRYIGGIAGRVANVYLSSVYASGTITNTANTTVNSIGGLIGYAVGGNVDIGNAYFNGSTPSDNGLILGSVTATVTFVDSIYVTNPSNVVASGNCYGVGASVLSDIPFTTQSKKVQVPTDTFAEAGLTENVTLTVVQNGTETTITVTPTTSFGTLMNRLGQAGLSVGYNSIQGTDTAYVKGQVDPRLAEILGLEKRGASTITAINSAGQTVSATFTSEDTVGAISTWLRDNLGATVNIVDGKISVSTDPNGPARILDASNDLDELLKLDGDLQDVTNSESSVHRVSTTIMETLTISEDTYLSDLGVTEGEFYLYANGVKNLIQVTKDDTIGSLMQTLTSHGIDSEIVVSGENSYFKIYGDDDNYLEASTSPDNASNIMEILFPIKETEPSSYSNTLKVPETNASMEIATEDTLVSIFDKNGNASAGVLEFNYDGNDYKITITSDDTFGTLIEKFEEVGVSASIYDGQLVLNSSDKDFIVYGNSSSNLVSNLGLNYTTVLDNATSSTSEIESEYEENEVFEGSAAQYADDGTKLSMLGISSGSLSIYRDGEKELVTVLADGTFATLKASINAAFTDVDLRFTNGYLEIYSTTSGVTIEVGATTDTSNIVAITGLSNKGELSATSSRELYKVNGDSKLTEADIFKRGNVTEGTFIIGNAEFTIDDKTTLNNIIGQINSSAEANATAYWDAVDGKFVIKSRVSGATFVNIEAGTSNFTDILGFTITERDGDGNITSTKLNVDTQEVGGNAQFSINGTNYTSTSNIVGSDVTKIKGLTLDLKGTSNGETVTVTVEKDYNTAADAMQEVVDAYNALIENVDKEVAMDGQLNDESTLKLLRNQIRSLMMGSIGGSSPYRMLSSIGISTESASASNISTTTINKLEFNKDKFIEAFRADTKAVENLLVGNGTQQGILTKVENVVENAVKAVTGYFSTAENSYTQQINRLDSKIEKANAAVAAYKSRLEQKFQYMDMMIAKMQEQFSTFLGT